VGICLFLTAFIVAPLIYDKGAEHLKTATIALFGINVVASVLYRDEHWCDVQPHLVTVVAALAVDYHR
jgi:hypothetical protein